MDLTIEINEEFKQAFDLLENTGENVFITGKAGTGKSTLLNYFRSRTRKNIAVLAPTGVAAVNIQGETIHSFFRFRPDVTLNKIKKSKTRSSRLYRALDMIVIDEISMVRSDLLDCVDKFLRLHGPTELLPFGGIQMVFIGDLYQLPPVIHSRERTSFDSLYASGYFFEASLFTREKLKMEFIELQKVYRQKDESFLRILNAIRNNTVVDKELALLNQRVRDKANIDTDEYIYLTTTNKTAAQINDARLNSLTTEPRVYHARVEGEFRDEALPVDKQLTLKEGARVMLLNNDSLGRWINGTIGTVLAMEQGDKIEDVVFVELDSGKIEEVTPYTWELFHYDLNQQTQQLESKTVGTCTQYPLKLAWAITIHKSQGKTFDKVIIDISGGVFACGQIYVALSRCRTLAGILLTRQIGKQHIFMDKKIVRFLTDYQYALSERDMPLKQKIKMIKGVIKKKGHLEIVYLKAQDEKSRRVIQPLKLGDMEYQGKTFLGIEAYCLNRGENRVFRADRILEMKIK